MRWFAAGLLAAGTMASPPELRAAREQTLFGIEAGSLDAALKDYMRITGRQILYPTALVSGLSAPGVAGVMDPDRALAQLLAGKPITAVHRGRNIYVLVADRSRARPASPPRAKTSRKRPKEIAQPGPQSTEAEVALSTIVVTGSHIRGGANGTSEVITLTATDMERAGVGTVAEAIATLPQNFGGTANEDTTVTGADRTTNNLALASSVNLRGLGADATLTLVNGRRVAGSGGSGDFADLSSIPAAAVQRIEVLADGASALYGSDAIGGVVNVILKRDFEGLESRFRLGSVTTGKSRDVQLGQVGGLHWGSGHALLAYEYQERGALRASDRRYTRSADLRPLGGHDYRLYFSNPGTILLIDPATGGFAPAFAIPSGQNGIGLTAADLIPGPSLSNQRNNTDLLPRQRRHAGYFNIEQEAADALQIYGEARYSHRVFDYRAQGTPALLAVTPSNPYFVSADGSPLTRIAYSFDKDLGPTLVRGRAEALSLTGGTIVRPGGDWQIDAYATYARQIDVSRNSNIANQASYFEALGFTPDDPATAFSTSRDGFFNPFADGAVNSRAMTDFIANGFLDERLRNSLVMGNVIADGSLFTLPGGAVKLAIGAQARGEHFSYGGESRFYTVAPRPIAPQDYDRSIRSAFAELAIPIFGAGNRTAGFERLTLSAAVRHEHYSDFGSTTNPKFGAVWEPIPGLTLRGSYGTSFRAPALTELGARFTVSGTQLPNVGGGTLQALIMSGGNTALKPETARSLNFGMRIAPPNWGGFSTEISYFDTRFRDRIAQPVTEQILQALTNPVFSPFVTFVNPVSSVADRQRVEALLAEPGAVASVLLPVENYRAIIDSRYVNTATVWVRGMDVSVSNTLRLGGDSLALSANASLLFDYRDRVTPTSVVVERVGTLGNPVDLRARASAHWTHGDFGAGVTVNYVGRYTDTISVPARPISDWAGFDLQLRYEPQTPSGWRDGLSVALNVQNVFDRDPPFVDRNRGYAYDAANADVLGRFASLQVKKRW
ncbi:TonB-dependent receptor [Sphingobium boeckii]|uniref:Outer membrane receptor protein involved in Fe transport n=1 Tax=Sphingobium boeckii TaxID=1082345 RepID=A0A7W9AGD4_9SPHN|nr:TonB-dependent receptor [Sphingobium boeckii]MBB5685017.1 outer membrane receptor protein involved in Fe transport [Sphingobium boeckii]